MRIRAAREDDHPALRELWRQLDLLHADIAPAYFSRRESRSRSSSKHLADSMQSAQAAVLVAVDADDRPTGAVRVRMYQTPDDALFTEATRGHVEDMVVDRGHRRRGVGRALMAAARQWCRSRGASEIVLTVWKGNQEGEAFYRALGYHPVARVLSLPLEPDSPPEAERTERDQPD